MVNLGRAGPKHLLAKNQVNPESVDYIIECSEEACGDVNQRAEATLPRPSERSAGVSTPPAATSAVFALRRPCPGPGRRSTVRIYKNVAVAAGGATINWA